MIPSSERHKQIMQSILDKEQEEIRKNLSFREDVLKHCYKKIDEQIIKYDDFINYVYIRKLKVTDYDYINLYQTEINMILDRYRKLGYYIKHEVNDSKHKFIVKVKPEPLWKRFWNYIRSRFCE